MRELDEKIVVDAKTFAEYLPEAQRLHAIAKANLLEAHAKAEKEAAERAELERLRAEAAERERKEEEAKPDHRTVDEGDAFFPFGGDDGADEIGWNATLEALEGNRCH